MTGAPHPAVTPDVVQSALPSSIRPHNTKRTPHGFTCNKALSQSGFHVYHCDMTPLLLVVGIYIAVYGTDYLFYVTQRNQYAYVSRRTYAIFIVGQIALVAGFFAYFEPFVANFATELTAIALILAVILLFSASFHVERLLVCNTASRTERCLTPGYVFVRGADIIFQQITYLLIALMIQNMFTTGIWPYLLYTVILVIMHTPVVLSMNKHLMWLYTGGIAVLATPFYYIHTELTLFWPAVYLHTLIYVFLWLAFADMEGRTVEKVDN